MGYFARGKKCEVDCIKFDSEVEAEYYLKLKELKSKKIIKDFKMQIKYELIPSFIDFRNGKVDSIDYIADYVVELNSGKKIVIDTKGSKTTTEESARLKQKIFMTKYLDEIYFVAPLPNYLGKEWVDISKGYDFSGKLKSKYKKLYGKWARNKTPNWTIKDWDEYFVFEDYNSLFYIWKETKKIKKGDK